MVQITSYAEVYDAVLASKNRYLLLGNGFSISLRPDIFSYTSLFAHAELAGSPHLLKVFESLGTEDFELVIKYLTDAARFISVYSADHQPLVRSLREDAALLKNILVSAIARRHPDRPYDVDKHQYVACRNFLEPYGHIYTLNYDVLLYWTLMQREVDDLPLKPDDGFRHPEDNFDEPYVSWQEGQKATVHYLHGALHLFDEGDQLVKYTWSKTDVPIVDQIRDALSQDKYPVFVAEGTSQSKMKKIMHSAYLHKNLRSLESCADTVSASFVIFGHSLAESDQHILNVLARGRFRNLYVSIYGDQNTKANQDIISSAQKIEIQRLAKHDWYPLTVTFFDATSAHVWG